MPPQETSRLLLSASLCKDSHLQLSKTLLHLLLFLGTIHNLTNFISKLVQLKLQQVIKLEAGIQNKLDLQANQV